MEAFSTRIIARGGTFLTLLIRIAASVSVGHAQSVIPGGIASMPRPLPAAIGGMYLPSGATTMVNGVPTATPATIQALVLFLEFGDDDSPETDSWPKGSPPARMMQDIIDRPGAPFSGNKYNITTYFRDMSGDRLRIVGNCYYVKTRYTLAQYRRGISQAEAAASGHPRDAGNLYASQIRYWATRHALEDIGRGNACDYASYDRWILNGYFDYHEAADGPGDGNVDLIIACWRNDGSFRAGNERQRDISFTDGGGTIEGISDLGCGPSTVAGEGSRGRRVNFGFPGSGVSAFNMAQYPRMEQPIHEIGHYLFGLDHHYDGGIWALMGHHDRNVSSCMNAYERSRLGWGTIQYIATDGETHLLADYPTTHLAYALPADPGGGEYYLFENHQRLPSPYISTQGMGTLARRPWGNAAHDRFWNVPSYDIVDRTTDPAAAEGIYIIHQEFPVVACEHCLQVVCADGRWNWDQAPCPFGTIPAPWNSAQQLAIWQRGAIARSTGTCDRQTELRSGICDRTSRMADADFLWAWRDPESGTTVGSMPKQFGDGHDMWNAERSTVFSQWSNPSTRASATSKSTAGMQIVAKVGNSYRIRFYLTSASMLSAAPSRPQDIRVAPRLSAMKSGGPWIPHITWAPNQEPDVVAGGAYHIYRRTEWPNGAVALNWTEIGTVDGRSSAYDDLSFWKSVGPANGSVVRYRVRAEDSQRLLSGISEEPALPFQGMPKTDLPPDDAADISSGLAAACFPNPCTAMATIAYRLPADGRVLLRIFDALGRPVATLADETKQAGPHTAWLDSHQMPAGVYLWVLELAGERVTGRVVVVR